MVTREVIDVFDIKPMDIQLFAVNTWNLDTQRRDIDVSKTIDRYLTEENPWLVLLLRSRKKVTTDPSFYWWETQPYAYWTRINNALGYNDAATDIVVDNNTATYCAPKDIIKIPRTGEVMQVTVVTPATHTLTVVRGYGETAAAAILHQDAVLVLGNAMEERSSVPAEKLAQPTKQYNYTQIFRTPFGASRTVEQSRQVTNEQERDRLTRDKGLDHRLALERAFLFGERKEDAVGLRRMTRGALKFISTNVYDAGGTITESEFDTSVCEPVFKWGKKTKVLAASARLISIMNNWGKEKLQVSQGAKEYGLDLMEYISPHGKLLITPCRTFEQYYAYHSMIIDMDHVWLRHLQDTLLRRNIHAPDVDGFLDEYMSEMGFELRLEQCHAIIKNATA